jgi:uncharacterized delta-60 repeat protein
MGAKFLFFTVTLWLMVILRSRGQASLATLQFSTSSYSTDEAAQTATFQVLRLGDLSGSVTVDYSTSDGTARAGTNYVAASGALQFGPGVASQSISLRILDDGLVQGALTVNLALGNPSQGATIGARGSATLEIRDHEIPTLLDPSFKADPSFSPSAFALQTDGKVVGGFYQGTLQRLNADGTADTSFKAAPFANSNTTYRIQALALQSDGKTLAAAYPNTVDQGETDPFANPYALRRLNADGSLDESFQPVFGSTNRGGAGIGGIWLVDKRIVVEGSFNSVNGIPRTSPVLLNPDGTVNPQLDPTKFSSIDPQVGRVPGAIIAAVSQSDGKLIVGGYFQSVGDLARTNLARLNSDGSVDAAFAAPLLQTHPQFMLLQSDGKVLIAGWEISETGASTTSISRLEADGSPDPSFVPGPELRVEANDQGEWDLDQLQLQSDGKVLLGGSTYDYSNPESPSSYRLLRLNPDGSLDRNLTEGFDLAGNSLVSAEVGRVFAQPDGRVVGYASFPTGNGTQFSAFGRFFSDYRNPGIGFTSGSYLVNEADGAAKINLARTGDAIHSVSARYATENGTAKAGLNYIAQSGTLSFAPLQTTQSFNVPILDDGLVTGDQTVLLTLGDLSEGALFENQTNAVLTIQDHEIPTPILDPNFSPTGYSAGDINSILLQMDGKIVLGGQFEVSGNRSTTVVRLMPDGALDPTFSAHIGLTGLNVALALALQPDGTIIAAGTADTVSNKSASTVFLSQLNSQGGLETKAGATLMDTNYSGSYAYASVHAMIIQPDGKLIVGGSFQFVNQTNHAGLARLNTDGTVDSSFNLGSGLRGTAPDGGELPGQVNALALGADGKLIVSGYFTKVNESDLTNLVRLNPDGSVDQKFKPTGTVNYRGPVAIQPDGKVLVTSYNLMRLNADGSIDSSFQYSDVSDQIAQVTGLTVADDGTIFMSAWFDTPQGDEVHRLVVLNTDGSLVQPSGLETTFDEGGVNAFAFEPGGGVLVAGGFTSVNGVPRTNLARLQAGSIANPGFEFSQASLQMGEDGGNATLTVLRTGNSAEPLSVSYATVNGSAKASDNFQAQSGTLDFAPFETSKTITIPILDDQIVEPNTQFTVTLANPSGGAILGAGTYAETVKIYDAERPGSVDFSFDPARAFSDSFTSFPISSLAPQPDGKVLLSLRQNVPGALSGRPTSVVRLNADGSLDDAFEFIMRFRWFGDIGAVYSAVEVFAPQADGKILIGGIFSTQAVQHLDPGEASFHGIARLNPDGTLDETFDSGTGVTDGVVQAISQQPDGKVIIGGMFATVNGVSRIGMARLNATGELDLSFESGTGFAFTGNSFSAYDRSPGIHSIIVQPDGKILAAGSFTNYQGTARLGIARLNPDGSLDGTFDPARGPALGGGSAVTPFLGSMVLQADRRIVVGGLFDTFAGVARPNVARLNPDGSLDPSFARDLQIEDSSTPTLLAGQPDGRILLANNSGYSTSNNSLQRSSLARLNPDGSLDSSFDAGTGEDTCCDIFALGVLPDGRLLVGGGFDLFDDVPRSALVRLHGDPPLRITSVMATSGSAQLALAGLSGRTYILEASNDLNSWLPVRTNSASSYAFKLTDPDASGLPHRFYRVRQWSP